MRTKLDEIVEEETREACPGAGAPRGGWMHRIAERAFRHGVEAATKAQDYDDITGKVVQPAPAEAKCANCGGVCPEWCAKADRRRGERRKGLEELGTVDYYAGIGRFGIWRVPQAPRWKQETRQSDRRKK